MEYILISVLLILMILSAFFSGTEISFAKVNSLRLKKASEENKKAALAFKLYENYPELISTILVGNNLVNIAASSISTVLCVKLFGANSGPTIATISMTLLILIFGEIIPKTFFSKKSFIMCLKVAFITNLFEKIFKPAAFVITKLVDWISPIWTPKKKNYSATDEELDVMVDEIVEDGVIDSDQGELIRSAIDFSDIDAYEIMTPRVDVFGFDINDDINELISDERIFEYSRIPVFDDSLDDIIGVINTRYVIKARITKEPLDLKAILIDPIIVHKTKDVVSLLKEFKGRHIHFAVVKDEFGGTMGIVTLEDVLEELVGEIWDETDEIVEEYRETKKGEYIVDGDMNIYDLLELVDIDDDDFETEYQTVGGFCTEILEHFPKENETFTFKNLLFTILEVDGIRVDKVKIDIEELEEE